jgi:hypothetical protein
MRRYLIAGVFGVLVSLVGDEAIAQGAQKSAPPNPVAVNAAHDHKKPRAIANKLKWRRPQHLSKAQRLTKA